MADYNNNSFESQNELEKFKTDIDLVGYLTNKEGYKIDNKITSNSITGLVKEETGSKIFVKVLGNRQQIFSDKKAPLGTGSSQGGTIIDYVKNYKDISNLGEVRKLLRQELNSGAYKVTYSQMTNKVVKKEVPGYSQEYFSFTAVRNTNYLNSRGIQNDTITSPTFAGRIGEKTIKSDRVDKTYNSTVFPMYEHLTEKVVGLEVKNEFYSGSFSGSNKQESFWKSNVPSTVKMPTAFIVESPLDALSHYELHNKKNKQGLIYYGTNGEIGGDSKRIAILSEYFEKRDNKFSAYKLGNDNDAAGVRFNINIIGNVNVKESDVTIKIIAEADQHYARITVVSADKEKLLKFQADANKVNNTLKLTTDHNMQYRNFNIVPVDDNKYKLSFLMNNRIDNLIPIEKLAITYRNSPFEIERSVGKDFSKDLETKLGIERTEVAYKNDIKGRPLTYSVWKKGDTDKSKNIDDIER